MAFNPNDHMMKVHGKDYLQVAPRIAWFRDAHPDWSIITSFEVLSADYCVATATVLDESGRILATGHKQESVAGWTDHLEKAETGAIGRALAILGYGTLVARELEEEDDNPHIVDTPVEPRQTRKEVAVSDEKRRLVGDAVKRGIPLTMEMSSKEMGDIMAAQGLNVVRQENGSVSVKELWNTVNQRRDPDGTVRDNHGHAGDGNGTAAVQHDQPQGTQARRRPVRSGHDGGSVGPER